VLDPVSVALKFGFLLVLYLFLLWVARSALRDLRRGVGGTAVAAGRGSTPSGSMQQLGDPTGIHKAVGDAMLVVEKAPGHESGSRYDITGGATLGRGDVEIVLEDPFASSRHARIERQGGAILIEDLGSTNGTYLNEELLRGPQPLHPGDKIRIGDSVFAFHS
jgi:hypothetical protein